MNIKIKLFIYLSLNLSKGILIICMLKDQILQERYQLQQNLGKKTGYQTWLAEDLLVKPSKLVIIKLLAFSPQMQWEEFKLFEREAQVLKNLNHPRIPKYQDYFSVDFQTGEGLCWFGLVQDYINGVSLQQLLDQGQRFPESQLRSIAIQILDILTYLHSFTPPVLHRDLKPSNLIWGEDEQVYLVDFGAVSDPKAVEGATFTIVGTAGYTPLEQFWGRAVPSSDLYALGATLIHLLTGIPPADLPQDNLRIQFTNQVSVNASFCRWIELLTEPDVEHRFNSASQAIKALQTKTLFTGKITKNYPQVLKISQTDQKLLITIPRNQLKIRDWLQLTGKLTREIWVRLGLILPTLGLSLVISPLLRIIFLLLLILTLF